MLKAICALLLAIGSMAVHPQTVPTSSPSTSHQFTFVAIQFPNSYLTRAIGVNAAGDIVGEYDYFDESDAPQQRGFLLRSGVFTTIEFPGSRSTVASSINRRGVLVGTYNDLNGDHGFRLEAGEYTTIDFPGATATVVNGINDLEDVVGFYWDRNMMQHAFVLQGRKFSSVSDAIFYGINRKREMVGISSNQPQQAFVYDGKTFTFLHYPAGRPATDVAAAISNEGQIAGFSEIESFEIVGWLHEENNYFEIRMPGAVATLPWGVNDNGIVVGSWRSSDMRWPQGFAAIPIAQP